MGGSISLTDLYDQARAAAEEELDSAGRGEKAAILLEALEQRLDKEEAREEALRILTEHQMDKILKETVGFSFEDIADALPPAPTCH